jgi:uncharacterized protein YlzI (FlbEa/FlbD family)
MTGHIKSSEYSFYKTKAEIVKEININPVLDKIQEYRKNVCNI